MWVPTREEREAFVWMQGRMVELLLRRDALRFDHLFAERVADPEHLPEEARAWVQPYRDLAVLFYLRDELFNSILPRIKRRLSFEAPREIRVEEPPTRGRIDWSRTAAAGWRERPGEVPLEVYTRQRRRHFTTPENLLTVVTLLEYRHAVQALLEEEARRDRLESLLHPLNEIVEASTRELNFPQFTGLVRECQEIASGYARQTPEELEERVATHLIPGRNSAYDDLLLWRRKLRRLRLLDRTRDLDLQPMLGSDPARDNYLYQLWLFFELGEFLRQRGMLETWDGAGMVMTFTWGDERVPYRLRHDRSIPESQHWQGLKRLPGVRPDFYLSHMEPQEVRHPGSGGLIWREAGFVLDAKYYRPREGDDRAPSSPMKRMLADLQLTGEKHGALLFAFHGNTVDASQEPDNWEEEEVSLTSSQPLSLAPLPDRAQAIQPDVHIDLWRLQPRPSEIAGLHRQFQMLLDHVHARLNPRVAIRCHGFFLDELSVNAHGTLADVQGLVARGRSTPLHEPQQALLCPKPHVAPWRVDIVHHSQCCTDPVVCHVMGQPGVRPPERLVRLEQVHEAIRPLRAGGGEAAEDVVQAATRQVRIVARRYADLLQPNLGDYRRQVKTLMGIGALFDTTPLLTEAQRDTLALGRFLWEQIEQIRASNYAGPTLLFTGVLEEVTRVAIFDLSGPLYDEYGRKLHSTLGTLGHSTRYSATYTILANAIVTAGHWKEQVTSNQTLTFADWLELLLKLSHIRNDAAHRANVSYERFEELCHLLFGSARSGVGAFNGLLLARSGHAAG